MSLNNFFTSDDLGIASASASVDSLYSTQNLVSTTSRRRSRNHGDKTLFRQIRMLGGLSGRSNNGHENGVVRNLDTFSGVFLPVCLSMFSAILFLRVGFILGNSGLLFTGIQMLLAYSILVFTVLSICAISTNGAIEGGGAYFMISRALGPEFGGSIGTLFFIANIFSSALYITGCVEGFLTSFGPAGTIHKIVPAGEWWAFLYGSCLNLFNMIVCFVGAAMFAKTSIFIFGIVMFSALSVILSLITQKCLSIPIPENNNLLNATVDHLIFTGFSEITFRENIYPQYGKDYTTGEMTGFASVFGVLFSGVTGIMAGANMSGELKSPGNSIPKGTLGAVAFTFITYMLIFLLTSATTPSHVLRNNYLYMQYIDYVPEFVASGIFFATLFAALSNLIGSSRVLEALGKDNLFGIILKPVVAFSPSGNPIFAVFVSGIIIEAILLIGSLNMIAQITSVFFLLSYFSINLACLALTLTSAPNFRPSFRYFSWLTSAIAMLGCVVMMLMINSLYAAFAFVMCLILVIVLHWRSPPVRWGSISQALIFHQVRKYLLLLDSRKDHVKYWRPQFLLMTANPRSCVPLIRFANDLKKSGLFLIGHVKVGNLDNYEFDPVINAYPLWLKLVDKLKVKAFIELTMCPSVREGLHHLARLSGLGAMKPNTVLLGFYDNVPPVDFFGLDGEYKSLDNIVIHGDIFQSLRRSEEPKELQPEEYVDMIYDSILKLHKNVVLARNFHLLNRMRINQKKITYIDVWPTNFFLPNESAYDIDSCWLFMMQLACILHMVPDWKRGTAMRVFLPSDSKTVQPESTRNQWQQMLKMLRIEAQIFTVFTKFTFPFDRGSETGSSVGELHFRDPTNEVTLDFSDEGDVPQRESNMKCLTAFQPSPDYLTDINELILENSEDTTVVFLYLPLPHFSCDKKAFLNWLTILSENLPPTLFVHGISPVTSTTL